MKKKKKKKKKKKGKTLFQIFLASCWVKLTLKKNNNKK